MTDPAPLSFEEFAPISLETWRAQVARDLKGKPLSDLQWHLNESITLEPFYNDESGEERPPLWDQPGWAIGERIFVSKFAKGKARLDESVAAGVEAPILAFGHQPDPEEWNVLWEGFAPEGFQTQLEELYPDKDPLALLERWIGWLEEQDADLSAVGGAIDFDSILDWADPPFARHARAVQLCREKLPRFRCVQVNARMFHGESDTVDRELALAVAKTSEYLAQLQAYDLSPADIADHLQVSFSVGTSYFLEIAKLRAFRILWLNLAEAYGMPEHPAPRIMVHLALESQTEDIHQNMIRASTQAMSAVLGGADLLYVLPANAALKERSTPFTRRIARNLQHLLKMEARIDTVADPAAGSYYIDKVTRILAERSWDIFQRIEADGGFMESRLV